MPTTEKQRRANRRNAQKSTGPKTNEGKQMSAQNAVRHGLRTQEIIIDSPHLKESREDYDSLLASLIEELKPQTAFQEFLVQRIANCLWRSRRAIRAESAQIACQLDSVDRELDRNARIDQWLNRRAPRDVTPEDEARARSIIIGRKSIPSSNASFNILRYEMRLDRQLSRAYALLNDLQKRASSPAPPEPPDQQNHPQTDLPSAPPPIAGPTETLTMFPSIIPGIPPVYERHRKNKKMSERTQFPVTSTAPSLSIEIPHQFRPSPATKPPPIVPPRAESLSCAADIHKSRAPHRLGSVEKVPHRHCEEREARRGNLDFHSRAEIATTRHRRVSR